MKRLISIVVAAVLAGCAGSSPKYTSLQYGPQIGALNFEKAFDMAIEGWGDQSHMAAADFVKQVESWNKLEEFGKSPTLKRVIEELDSYKPYNKKDPSDIGRQKGYGIYKAQLLALSGKPDDATKLIQDYANESRIDVYTSYYFCSAGLRAAKTAKALSLRTEALAAVRMSVTGQCATSQHHYEPAIAFVKGLDAPEELEFLQTRSNALRRLPDCEARDTTDRRWRQKEYTCKAQSLRTAGMPDAAHYYERQLKYMADAEARARAQSEPSGWTRAINVMNAATAGILAAGPSPDRTALAAHIGAQVATTNLEEKPKTPTTADYLNVMAASARSGAPGAPSPAAVSSLAALSAVPSATPGTDATPTAESGAPLTDLGALAAAPQGGGAASLSAECRSEEQRILRLVNSAGQGGPSICQSGKEMLQIANQALPFYERCPAADPRGEMRAWAKDTKVKAQQMVDSSCVADAGPQRRAPTVRSSTPRTSSSAPAPQRQAPATSSGTRCPGCGLR